MLDDKYRIEHLLAVGGMGAVYVGTHVRLRKRVAIKVINPQLSSAAMIERFHREAITASQIGHEGIAQVTDIGTSGDGEPFLVMEYLEGESLASRLRTSGALSVEDACELACSILAPLAAAHRAGIVHRDLKPDNVFLVRQSRGEMVKLLDFGISRASGLESEFRLTTTGLVLGTPYYMAPEQARGDHEITPAADLYAIGVILYEMLIGSVPIQADNYNQLMYRVMMGEFPLPRARRPDLPEVLELLILQAMAQEPTHRPPGASELELALLAFCRPAFRDRSSGRMSAPQLPLASASGAHAGAARGGTGRGPSGIDHTLIAGSHSAPVAQPTPPIAATVTDPPAKPRSRAPWLAAGVIVIAAVAGIAYVATGERDAAPPPPPTPPIVLAPTPPPPAPTAAPPAPTAAPTTITLKFTVDASNATITVDGNKLDAGELTVAKDDAPHALHITAPGRAAHDETLHFDENQRLTIQLPHLAAPPRPSASKPRAGHDVVTDSPYN
jgi:serine/threonine protein kinase